MRADMAQICYFAGEYDAAIAHCREALELDPSFPFAHGYLADAYAQKGMYPEAVEEIVRCLEASGASPAVVAAHRDAFAKSGWPGFCRARMKYSASSPVVVAVSYADLGDTERAIEQLRKGCDQRDFFLIFAAVEPRLAPLRSDPRFLEIARRVGVL